ncbi:ParA family protein [Clostridium algoriphilum]|uniref:ParA family protein n=1 Tax=Clostridium algoriphilum TaxID=198347 RepID=UPI001CF4FAAE|nr:ParA family protein [Clostridium algoriphilum]MCB2296084.1 ParA family protein [Clostridium algoriphilum]
MTIVISFVNCKGGTGKTTSCVNLVGQIEKQGHRVLLIDNDAQGNASKIMDLKSPYSLFDLYSISSIGFEDCIVKYNDKIDVITNDVKSFTLESELHNKRTRETILKTKFAKFSNKKDYDFVIIDNSPFIGIATTNALTMSDYYISVIDKGTSALQNLHIIDNLVKDIIDLGENDDLKLLGILRNNFDKKTIFTRQMNEVIEDSFKNDLFNTIIYNSIKYVEAITLNKTIQDYNNKWAEPYKHLYYEIISKVY